MNIETMLEIIKEREGTHFTEPTSQEWESWSGQNATKAMFHLMSTMYLVKIGLLGIIPSNKPESIGLEHMKYQSQVAVLEEILGQLMEKANPMIEEVNLEGLEDA